MSKEQTIAINDAVHKIQLALLNGITSQKQLFSAGTLMSQSDYEDVVTERTIAKLCGYPLCRATLPSEVSKRGKYRISLKEHKVYDVVETRKFCSSDCLVKSRAFGMSLDEVRRSEFDMVKLSEVLGLFGDESVDVEEGLGELRICENSDVRGGDVSLEKWMGPSSAGEGYVPVDRSKGCKDTKNKQKKHEDLCFNEMGFTSTVIVPDVCSVSKVTPQSKQGSSVEKSELRICENSDVRVGEVSLGEWMGPSSAVEGYVPVDRSNCKTKQGCKDTKNKQKKHEDLSFNEMGFTSTVIVPDVCSVSKVTPQSKQASPVGKSEDGQGKKFKAAPKKSSSKADKNNQKKHEDLPFNEMGFTSTVIVPDECSVPKLTPQSKQPSPVGKVEDGQGKTPKKSRFRREKEKDRIDFASFGFDAMGCASSVTASDGYSVEYSVSKQPPSSTEDPLAGQLKDGLKTLDEKCSLTGSSSASKEKGLRLPTQAKQASHVEESGKGKAVMTDFKQNAVLPGGKPSNFKDLEVEKDITSSVVDEMGVMSDGYSVEYSVSKQPPSSMEDPLSSHLGGSQTLDKKNALLGSSSGSNTKGLKKKPEKLGKKVISCEDGGESLKGHQDMCSSSEAVTKSCLKVSGSKKLTHSVTWADQNDGRGDLCEVRSDDIESGLNLSSTDKEDVNSASRLALAEACATALSHAAEAVSSGDLDASDAAAEAGILLLPSTHQLDEEVSEEETSEEEATLLKWPNKPGTPDSNMFDRDQSWFDGPPEGFNLTLSTFAMMWDSLFGWVSSSSLAYIYGKDESAHEEFLSVNGKEYPRRVIMGEGLSSEIKETIAGCLARAVPRVATDLRLPIAISELEKGLGSLLETMSLRGAVPSFRVEQWLVIVLLFLDALSVSRIPRIAPYISNKNKVLEGSGIGNEEYETMKDILLPLGRVPQFANRSGA